jgi:TonB family protein
MSAVANRPFLPPAGGGYDPLPPMLLLSVALHLLAFVVIAVYSKYTAHAEIKMKPDNYVVHLIDPGETPGAPGIGKSAIVDTAPPPPPSVKKSVPVEKKLLPISKEHAKEVKKVPVVKKVVEKVKAEPVETQSSKRMKSKTDAKKKPAEAVAKEAKEKKGGGAVDIKKFPYEWYLRVMETKVYGNWDTLKVNLFADRPVKVVVMFAIDRQGNLAKVEVEQSSFNGNIDNSALDAVKLSAPFPPLPPGYKDDTLDVHFGFTIEPQH